MGSRIGRKYAQHAYPTSSRGGAASSAFARNYASGPTSDTVINTSGGTQIPWANIDVGSPGVVVPITPLVTGVLRISGTVSISTAAEGGASVQLVVELNGSALTVPANEKSTTTGVQAMPFLVEAPVQPVGTSVNISIRMLTSSGPTSIVAQSSTLEVQEVPVATG